MSGSSASCDLFDDLVGRLGPCANVFHADALGRSAGRAAGPRKKQAKVVKANGADAKAAATFTPVKGTRIGRAAQAKLVRGGLRPAAGKCVFGANQYP